MSKTNVNQLQAASLKTQSAIDLSDTHRLQLFSVARRLLVRLLERIMDAGVHAVNALRPLSIDHPPLLLTGSPEGHQIQRR